MSVERKSIGLFFGGCGLTLVTALLPGAWPAMPKEIYWAGILFGVVLMAWGLRLFFRREPMVVETTDLKRLANHELRAEAIQMANRMRALEANAKASQTTAIMGREHRTDWTDQQRTEAWNRQNRRHAQLRSEFDIEFQTRYRPTALALLKEIRIRLGLSDGDKMPLAFDLGMLAGVNPVTEAADYLDELARELRI